jgi:hypothetical protein
LQEHQHHLLVSYCLPSLCFYYFLLLDYDWLHLHHEDFTGQYGRFYSSYNNTQWYRDYVKSMENLATLNGFAKVSQMKLAVAKRIQEFVAGGGFMFAMCSATDTYDIALAADGLDIIEQVFDGDPADWGADKKLDYNKGFAFKDYKLYYLSIQIQPKEKLVFGIFPNKIL